MKLRKVWIKLSVVKNPNLMAKIEVAMETQVKLSMVNYPVTTNVFKTAAKLKFPTTIPTTAERGKHPSRTLFCGIDKDTNRSRPALYAAVFSSISTTQPTLMKPYPWFLVTAPYVFLHLYPPPFPINLDQGTIPFMSSKILLDYKNGTVAHSASDDIESLVYVLVWMCVLYAGPGVLRKDKHVTQTVLKPWVTVSSVTDVVSLGVHKAGLKIHPRTVTDEFTLFFKPLCLTVSRLLTKLGELSPTDHIHNYQAIRDILLEGFGTVEEDPNWSGAKDVHGYGLLQQDTKRKLPVYATGGYEEAVLDFEDSEADSPRVVRRRRLN